MTDIAKTPLTRREQQVAELVAEGLSNKDVAARLVIAQRTAEGHVERILAKLGFTSRTQLAAWVTPSGDEPGVQQCDLRQTAAPLAHPDPADLRPRHPYHPAGNRSDETETVPPIER